MNIQYAFLKTLERVNQLSSNGGQLVTKWKFVEAFNKAQLHWVKYKLSTQDNQTTDNLALYGLLKFPTLTNGSKKDEFTTFEIPKDFLWFSSGEGYIGSCRLELHYTDEYNVEALIKTGYFQPKFEEGLIHLRDKQIAVYPLVDKLRFTYYRKPVEVNMVDIEDPIEGVSANVDPEWDGINLEEILDMTAQLLSGNLLPNIYEVTSRHIMEHNKSA